MYATCCPAYTIRLESSRFILSKKQRQVVRRVERYLECDSVLQCDEVECASRTNNQSTEPSSTLEEHSSSPTGNCNNREISGEREEMKTENPDNRNKSVTGKKAKMCRNTHSGNPCHELKMEMVKPENTTERYELYRKYQISVHGDEPSKITQSGFSRFLVDSPLTSTTVRAGKGSVSRKQEDSVNSLGEKEESKLKEKNTKKSGKVSERVKVNDQNSVGEKVTYNLGTYHQLYRLDGKLVAVGVVDILPSGLSSVYLFYDPDVKQLSLGEIVCEDVCVCVCERERERGCVHAHFSVFLCE